MNETDTLQGLVNLILEMNKETDFLKWKAFVIRHLEV